MTRLPSVRGASEARARPWLSGRLTRVVHNHWGYNTITLGSVVAECLEPSHDEATHANVLRVFRPALLRNRHPCLDALQCRLDVRLRRVGYLCFVSRKKSAPVNELRRLNRGRAGSLILEQRGCAGFITCCASAAVINVASLASSILVAR